jgi:hypothetical protein
MLKYVQCIVYREQSAVYGENPVCMTQMLFVYWAGTGYLGEVPGKGRNILFPSIARPAVGPTTLEMTAGWSWILKVKRKHNKEKLERESCKGA